MYCSYSTSLLFKARGIFTSTLSFRLGRSSTLKYKRKHKHKHKLKCIPRSAINGGCTRFRYIHYRATQTPALCHISVHNPDGPGQSQSSTAPNSAVQRLTDATSWRYRQKVPSEQSPPSEFVCPNSLQPHHSKRSRTQSICTSLCHTYATLQTLTCCNKDVLCCAGYLYLSSVLCCSKHFWSIVSDISALPHSFFLSSIHSRVNLTFIYMSQCYSLSIQCYLYPTD